jgi:hypothetical protein
MSRRIVQTSERTYLFSPDDPGPLGGSLWELVKLRVIDELTGKPPNSSITIQAKEKGLVPRVASDGIVGLVGVPQQIFPGLKTTNYTVHLTVRAEGYAPRDVEAQVASDPLFPATFTPPPLINLALHREPILITGRTVKATGITTTPLAGSTVSVIGVWRTPPPADLDPPADPPNLVSLRPPLYAGRTAGTGLLWGRNLTPIVGDDKLLLEDALAGDNPIRLSNRQNLAQGDNLLIDAQQPDIAEFLAINLITGASTADQPAYITLDYPVAFEHRRNAVIQKVNPQPLVAMKQFTVEAMSGDTCVFLDDVTGLGGANEALITGGATPDEHHNLMLFSVTSDADGYYRLPPLSRVAQVKINATNGALNAEVKFQPDYSRRENHLDLILKS